MDIFTDFPMAFIAIGAIALCIGSFLTVVIYRLPKILERKWQAECKDFLASAPRAATSSDLSLYLPSSHCPRCEKKLKWRHNIPLISFICLRGRCAYCHVSIKSYFLIEFVTLTLWLTMFYIYGMTLQFFASVTACTFLIALAYIDQREKILPDELTMGMLWAGLIFNSFDLFTDITSAVFGAVGGYAVFLFIKQSFRLVSGKHGLGQGDLKLLAAIGAWLGWDALPGVVLIASVSGIFTSLPLIILKRRNRKEEIAFGPYLAFAGVIGLIYINGISDPFALISDLK